MAKTHSDAWNLNTILQRFLLQAPVCACSGGFFNLEGVQTQLILPHFRGALYLWAVLFGDRSLHLNLCVTKMKSGIGFMFLLIHFGTDCHTLLKKQSQCYELQSWFNNLNISSCPDTNSAGYRYMKTVN